MITKDDAIQRLVFWSKAYAASLLLPVCIGAAYTLYSFLYTPPQSLVLLNQFGGVYTGEDLSSTSVTEGQVKQFAHEVLQKTFVYDYLSFVSDDEYKELVSGKIDTDLPDHRDLLSPWFSKTAHTKVVEKLKKSPWMDRFYLQRRQLTMVATSPPLQDGNIGFSKSTDGRLTISYRGHLFLSSTSKGMKTMNYKLDYVMTLERKPLYLENNSDKYYFGPMNPINAFDWWVKDIDWTTDRRG